MGGISTNEKDTRKMIILGGDTIHNTLNKGRDEVEGKSIEEIILVIKDKINNGLSSFKQLKPGIVNSLDKNYLKDRYHLGTQVMTGFLGGGGNMTYTELVTYLMLNFEEDIEGIEDGNEVKKILNEGRDRIEKLIWNFIRSGIIHKEGELLTCKLNVK